MKQFVPIIFLLLAILLASPGCVAPLPAVLIRQKPAYKSWIVGDTADVAVQPLGGVVLAGGSTDVDDAMRWFLNRSGGGDVLIIRASGSDGYNEYLYRKLGVIVNSVETVLIDNRALANQADIIRKVRFAEAIFFAGGDQANYVNFYQNTPLADALNERVAAGAVLGGTSAGCAILGQLYFSAKGGSITSGEALANPFDARITLGKNDFLSQPLLANTITDQHYSNRDRQGRHVVFLARAITDWNTAVRGIGVDEQTAVCVTPDGETHVFGRGNAYFLLPAPAKPDVCRAGQPLTWTAGGKAVHITIVPGSASGTTGFDLKRFAGTGRLKTAYWFVENGQLN